MFCYWILQSFETFLCKLSQVQQLVDPNPQSLEEITRPRAEARKGAKTHSMSFSNTFIRIILNICVLFYYCFQLNKFSSPFISSPLRNQS